MAKVTSNVRQIRGKSVVASIDKTIYETPRSRKEWSRLLTQISFGCPTEMEVCGKLNDIVRYYSPRNVFIAIPYSRYAHEKAIKRVLKAAELRPILAKDKIQTTDILCKICNMMRKCEYLVADISSQNANVAYELGLMQSLGKNCAILFSSRIRRHKQKQTDLEGIEDVRYSTEKELKRKLGGWIKDNVKDANKTSLTRFIKNL